MHYGSKIALGKCTMGAGCQWKQFVFTAPVTCVPSGQNFCGGTCAQNGSGDSDQFLPDARLDSVVGKFVYMKQALAGVKETATNYSPTKKRVEYGK